MLPNSLLASLALMGSLASSPALPSTCTVNVTLPALNPGSAYYDSYGVNSSTGSFTYCTQFEVASALDLDIWVAGVILGPYLMFEGGYAVSGPGLSPTAWNLFDTATFENLAPGEYLLTVDATASLRPLGDPRDAFGHLQVNFNASAPTNPSGSGNGTVSEPSTWALLAAALAGVGISRRRKA